MKVTDLKVNDWVIAKGKVSQLVGVLDNFPFSRVYIMYNGFCMAIAEEDIKPIPLTSDILTANGFRQQWDYIFTIPATQPNELWLWDKGGEWEVTYNNNDLLTTIRFVHELQHLLWALGLDDNLKIE